MSGVVPSAYHPRETHALPSRSIPPSARLSFNDRPCPHLKRISLMSGQSRRDFSKTTAAAGIGAFAIAGTKASGRVLGANDRIRVARGRHQRPRRIAHRRVHRTEGRRGRLPDRSRQPAVRGRGRRPSRSGPATRPSACRTSARPWRTRTSTPSRSPRRNHWHSLMTIWACQAGKDVYVEKPCSHNVFEGRKCVEAARKYKRIVQHGTQQRSDQDRANEMAAVQSRQVRQAAGVQGLLLQAALEHRLQADRPSRPRNSTSTSGSARPPSSRITRTSSTTTGTGSGTSATATSATRASTRWTSPAGPSRTPRCPRASGASAAAGSKRPDYKDQGQTPNMQLAVFDFGDVCWSSRSAAWSTRQPRRPQEIPAQGRQRVLHDRGQASIDGKFYPNGGGKAGTAARQGVRVTPGGAVRQLHHCGAQPQGRRPQRRDPRRPLLRRLCHLANISYRLGKPARSARSPTRSATTNRSSKAGKCSKRTSAAPASSSPRPPTRSARC